MAVTDDAPGAARAEGPPDRLRAGEPGLRVALLAVPGAPAAVARGLVDGVGARLRELRGGAPVEVEVLEDPALGEAGPLPAVVERLRRRLLDGDHDLVLGFTDRPLTLGRRPVAGHASPTHGVAVLSVPTLGPTRTAQRARESVDRLVVEVLGEEGDGPVDAGRRGRLGRRLAHLREVGDDRGGYAAVLTGGYLSLLAGLVRANDPWRFALRLSRTLVAALAAVAFALVTRDLWALADGLGPVRLGALTLASIGGSTAALVVVHDMWERPGAKGRAQAALFNLATVSTVLLGVATLYVALLVLTVAIAAVLLPGAVVAGTLGHDATPADYLQIAWLISSLATVGGGLGGGLESDASVHEATYASDGDDDAGPPAGPA